MCLIVCRDCSGHTKNSHHAKVPRPKHSLRVLWEPQGSVQMRVVEDIPEPIYGLPISPRLIGNHLLDRSQRKRENCVAAVLQRRSNRLGTDEFAETHNRRGISELRVGGKFCRSKSCAILMASVITRSELMRKARAEL